MFQIGRESEVGRKLAEVRRDWKEVGRKAGGRQRQKMRRGTGAEGKKRGGRGWKSLTHDIQAI